MKFTSTADLLVCWKCGRECEFCANFARISREFNEFNFAPGPLVPWNHGTKGGCDEQYSRRTDIQLFVTVTRVAFYFV